MSKYCWLTLVVHRISLGFIVIIFASPSIVLARSYNGLITPLWGYRGGSAQRQEQQQQLQQLQPQRLQLANDVVETLTSSSSSTIHPPLLSIGVVTWGNENSSESLKSQTKLPLWLRESNDTFCALLTTTTTPNETTTTFRFGNVPTDEAMVETIALTCDIVLLVMSQKESPSSSRMSPDMVAAALVKGIQRRQEQGNYPLRRSVILVLAPFDKDDVEAQAWKDHVVVHDGMSSITPDLVERFELVTPRELGLLWDELVNCNSRSSHSQSLSHTNSDDSDAELFFPALLQEAYRSLSGNKDASVSRTDYLVMDNNTATTEQRVVNKARSNSSTTTAIRVQQVLWEAQRQLQSIESRQEQIWLDDTSTPMLEFGSMADEILNNARDQLHAAFDNDDSNNDDECQQLLMKLAIDLRQLYHSQLQALREHYGRRYDAQLESTKEGRLWTAAAADATERFRVAAQHAIPTLCRENGPLRDADFNYIPFLHGLISDMTQATALRQDLESSLTEDLDEDEVGDDVSSSSSKGRPKWYHKLGARCLVLGVNYIQGWLAWKAIQRAADERDRNIPKFPLF